MKRELPPERSLEFDEFRELKHGDPCGRINLGRKFAYATFVVEKTTHGAVLLRPAVILEKRMLEGGGDFRRIPTRR